MSARKKTKAKKKIKIELPDLTEIFYAFSDAQALVSVACESIMHNNNPGRAVSVLYLGVEALDSVADRLEQAEIQFDRFRRNRGNVQGGAS
jgi:hypothetical protein